ncbi:MAG TPA: hypothetical protein PK659_10425 [Methanothrix sp.]|nr:hypothetical protein [Methanothrix sp.]HOK59165.1 hypothetical protein [Methanothrix sp.]HOL44657.1 hypothetical protein [Methanothrix sp.]HPO89397.1 hypothetical protein [Methanothrix sp.]
MTYGCLVTNGKIFDTGECRCHGALDIALNSSGAMQITAGPSECVRQRILMWLATKKGERYDPRLGCCLHSYLHKPITKQAFVEIESAVREELKLLFPDVPSVGVKVWRVDRNTLGMRIDVNKESVTVSVDRTTLEVLSKMYENMRQALQFQTAGGSR